MKRFILLALLLAGCAAPQQIQQIKLQGIDGQVMLPVKRGEDIIFEPIFLFRAVPTNAPPQSNIPVK